MVHTCGYFYSGKTMRQGMPFKLQMQASRTAIAQLLHRDGFVINVFRELKQREMCRAWACLLLLGSLLLGAPPSAAAAGVPSREEYEALSDRLADSSLALAECKRDVGALQAELADLKVALSILKQSCERSGDRDAKKELGAAQAELAAAEEQLQAAQEHLQEDEADFERDGRDLATLMRQLFATRAALLEARQRVEEQEARLQAAAASARAPAPPCRRCPAAGVDGGCAAALLDLQQCREEVGLLQERGAAASASAADGCSLELELLAETRRRIAELAEERSALAERLEKVLAEKGTCPPPPPPCAAEAAAGTQAEAGSGITPVPNTTPRNSRRAELLQNQMLAEALEEVAALEEANQQLRNQIASINWEGSTLPDLRAAVSAANNRSAELSEELSRSSRSLALALNQVDQLTKEREELKSSFASTQAVATSCQTRSAALMEAQKRVETQLTEAKKLLSEANEAADRRVAAAEAEGKQRLTAAQEEASARLAEQREDAAARLEEQRVEAAQRLAQQREEAAQRLAATQLEATQKLAAAQEEASRQALAADERLAAARQDAAKQAAAAEERLAEVQREAAQKLAEAHGEAAKQAMAAEERQAAAVAEVQRRLEAVEVALEAVEREKTAVAAEKKAAEGAAAAAERARSDAEVALAAAQAELRTMREAKEAEIERLLQVLKAHEDAAREMQRANEMLRQAESGWLPLWAQRRWNSLSSAAGATAAALHGRAMATWSQLSARVAAAASSGWAQMEAVAGQQLQPAVVVAQRARQAAGQAWAGAVRPVLLRAVPNLPELEAAARARLGAAAQQAAAAAAHARARAAAAKAAADAAVLAQLERAAPALRLHSLATLEVASALVWGLVGFFTLPPAIALALATTRYLVFRLRPGSVRVATPGSSGGWARLEEALGYQFERHATLAAAVDGDGGGGSGRFAWLGSALLQLLAAESAFQRQPEGAGPEALAAASEALAGQPAVAARAAAASLPCLVLPGPGAKSRQLAADKAAQLYAACLGAAYVDAGYCLEAARKVFDAAAAAGAGAANGVAQHGARLDGAADARGADVEVEADAAE